MLGQMMEMPLVISSLLTHAARYHGDAEIVSRTLEGPIHRYTYRDVDRRSRRLANVLLGLGVRPGDRVATLAWNTYRHLELYFGIAGIGAIVHTVNPRLHPEQVAWIANHAEDGVLFFDVTFAPLVEKVASECPTVKAWVAMTDRAHMPDIRVPNLLCYEDLMDAAAEIAEWPDVEERSAVCLCYTSGTTGNPKGVLYSHRSTMLHTLMACHPDVHNLSARDTILPVVPMFHVNAWSIPYAAAMVGARLIFPGQALDGPSLVELFEGEKVTYTAGVPTVWLGLLQHLQKNGLKLSTVKRMVVGGSACPPALMKTYENDYGIKIHHAWGMTEMSPLGTFCTLKSKHLEQSPEERFEVEIKQGRPMFGVDMKIVDPQGQELPHDGKHAGDLLVRGHWIIGRYFKIEGSPLVDGWFPTGDVATIDEDGFMQITDRSKDVIKSGGEWISSIDLENLAMSHPCVAMAAVIALPHPKWDERPLLVVVRKPGSEVTRDELIRHYDGKIAKWWTPDDVVFTDSLPLGATGKVQKNKLREQFGGHKLPGT